MFPRILQSWGSLERWLGRRLLLGNPFFFALLVKFVLIWLAGWCLILKIPGRSSWICDILVGIFTSPFVVVLLPCAGGLMESFAGLLSCMPCLWTLGAGFGFFILCSYLLLCIVMRPVVFLTVVFADSGQHSCCELGLVVILLPILVPFLLFQMGPLDRILLFMMFGVGFE